MVAELMRRPELHEVKLFEAGVEPENVASRRCLTAAGFSLRSEQPDFEGMLYYHAWRGTQGAYRDNKGASRDSRGAFRDKRRR
jgi:RimJ/RimL family protein N-acetyltransferase